MQLLEYESKRLIANHGIAIPQGRVISSVHSTADLDASLGDPLMIKAQVPIGGRGKNGGIVKASRKEAGNAVRRLLGRRIRDFLVRQVLAEQYVESKSELYLAVAVDSAHRNVVLLMGAGGVDVEQAKTGHTSVPISLRIGPKGNETLQAVRDGRIDSAIAGNMQQVAAGLFSVFRKTGARLVEINPLLVTKDDALIAGDARVITDEVVETAYPDDQPTLIRRELGFDYIELDVAGDIGLVTTGAGGSMMLVDLLRQAGLRPINFCDLRTGSLRGNTARLLFVLGELASHPTLSVVGVNIFAGVTNLQEFADLFVESLAVSRPPVPIIARIEGANRDEGVTLLRRAGLTCVDSLDAFVAACAAAVSGNFKSEGIL